MNDKPVQPDVLGGIPHVSNATSVGPSAIVGPIQIDSSEIGVYLKHGHMAELKTLLQYAASRLDSGKVSPELRASEPIVRRVLRWIEIAEAENARRAAAYERAGRGPESRDQLERGD